ncbi:hypothetical protein [Pseudonocardia alaniniphila]|uniref:Uncharacterized protein n=1 Tax=Pseudonocardia alaniniphila TaxID=75291 RepID=A0ABS9TUI3_9PSEU|nr:hypothetical protein [Pseudonocardia alaniniphila]MCH6172189.1 hypothetical protein [Pseudonocardia alaniniphila]
MHVHRFGPVPVTLVVQPPAQGGNPTMWATIMPTTAAGHASHAVEILGEGLPERVDLGWKPGEPCVDG